MYVAPIAQQTLDNEDTIFLPHATVLVFKNRPDSSFCKEFLSAYFNFIVLPRLRELPVQDSRIIPVIDKITRIANDSKGGFKR